MADQDQGWETMDTAMNQPDQMGDMQAKLRKENSKLAKRITSIGMLASTTALMSIIAAALTLSQTWKSQKIVNERITEINEFLQYKGSGDIVKISNSSATWVLSARYCTLGDEVAVDLQPLCDSVLGELPTNTVQQISAIRR